MIEMLDTLDSDRESMGSLKALLRENEKGRPSRASMGNLINPGFIAFWADTRKGRNAHGGCNSRVNVYYGCLGYLGEGLPVCQYSSVKWF